MKHLILAAATLLLVQGADAREHRGPPPLCPTKPKADCARPKPCPSKAVSTPKCKPEPKSCEPACVKKPDPCCTPLCFEPAYPTKPCCTPNAYSTPAGIDLNGGWDVFVTTNFIYWQGIQGGMDIALPAQATAVSPLGTVTQSALGNAVFFQDFEYEPGFQVGFGWSGAKDDWTLYGEYTWVRGSNSTTSTAQAPGVSSVSGATVGTFGVLVPSSWLPGVYTANNTTTSITSSWDYSFDIADFEMSRPFYSGARFILEPLFGIRALWLSQDLDLSAVVLTSGSVASPASSPRQASYSSSSWGLGPRMGFNGKWHLGYGIRFIGDTSASLLFTRYTDVSQDVASPDTSLPPVRLKLDNFDALRPNMDFSLGFGWGSYFSCRRMHLDLAATYDFSIFWEQNMMRYLADLTADATSHTNGAASNFFLHGLTIKTAFEF